MATELDAQQKKQLRALAHRLNPVVTIGDRGLSEGVEQEIERALDDHELIKIKLAAGDPGARKALARQICDDHGAALVQQVGRVAVILRRAAQPNPKLSNLSRLA